MHKNIGITWTGFLAGFCKSGHIWNEREWYRNWRGKEPARSWIPVQARPNRHGADWQTRSYVRIQNCKPGRPDYDGPNTAGNVGPVREQAVSIPARQTGRQAEWIWLVPTKTASESFLPILSRADPRNAVVDRKGQDSAAGVNSKTIAVAVGYMDGGDKRGQYWPVPISSQSRKSAQKIVKSHNLSTSGIIEPKRQEDRPSQR